MVIEINIRNFYGAIRSLVRALVKGTLCTIGCTRILKENGDGRFMLQIIHELPTQAAGIAANRTVKTLLTG
jgi:hypothetical protein